jgi:hypothetical protein
MITRRIPSRASYLSNCDLINKYTLLSVHRVPLLSSIFLELSSSDILNALEKMNQSDSNAETKIELFLILYVFKLFQPTIRNSNCDKDKDFLLQVSFSKEKEISLFLTILFVENWSKTIFQEVSSYNKKFSSFKITGETFFNVERFLEINKLGIDSNKLILNCKFVFENHESKNQAISIKLIKNIVPFWISC